jgi:hypothetical protein
MESKQANKDRPVRNFFQKHQVNNCLTPFVIVRFAQLCVQKPGAMAKEVALLLWICDQGIPFSAFDRLTWKNFEAFSNIKLSGSSTLFQHRLPVVFAAMQKQLSVLLDQASCVVPILDGWETTHGGKLIGMIYSFLTDSFGRFVYLFIFLEKLIFTSFLN